MTDVSAAPSPTIHIVVTCANRKTRAVPEDLRLRDLRHRQADQRFAAWADRLTTSLDPATPARDLYAGEHWQIARELPIAVKRPANLWVCSAGYGLISAGTPIKPYSATFSPGVQDSVAATAGQARDWWALLSQWPGPALGTPRSFSELARLNRKATIVAVLSEAYMRACASDLRSAATELADGEQLAVIGPSDRDTGLEDLLVGVTARLRPVVGGSMQSLNVRVARHLLSACADSGDLGRSQLAKLVQQATAEAPEDPSRRPPGQPMTDNEVRAYIRSARDAGPTTATASLRRLRQSGRSCEQARFKHLFMEVTAGGRP